MTALHKIFYTLLAFFDELRLELGGAVARHVNLDLPALTFDGFRRFTVTRVTGVLTGGVMLCIAEMMSPCRLAERARLPLS